ncbi:MAG: Zn-dependent hydrolase [Gemmatimonadota bacterium]|nr:MAG: Zn-dependent hydrolase [Gemmatimonadota bacterium]
MRNALRLVIAALAVLLGLQACTQEGEETAMTGQAGIEARMQKYALTPMQMDLRGYSDREKALLGELLRAAELSDEIFWRQTSHLSQLMREEMEASYAVDDPLRRFFMMQAGPWDRLDHDAPFIDDAPHKSPGAGFYPDDLMAEEFEGWIAEHPEDREAFMSPYTLIRREGDSLVAVPYHEAYAEFVGPMAESLRRAAQLAENESFARYLRLKADALLDDEYFDTDTAWIAMSGSKFDITIGPFEVYEDGLMNIKAAYEGSVEIVDREESAKLEVYKQHLGGMEAALPYDERYKPEGHGLTANFTIVGDIYRGGHLRVGYQPVAASLPNDPRVLDAVGSKKTFWKNFFEARVNAVILPISQELIVEQQADQVTPQAFFDVVLLHEIAHALGPRYAETAGGRVPVNQALTTHYSWIEEAKATIAGLESLNYLIDAGIVDPGLRHDYYASYLGSIFRTIRFGTGEAHGLAALVELNYFLENGAITYDTGTRRYAIDYDALPGKVTELAEVLLTIEAAGDFDGAQALQDAYGTVGPALRAALERVAGVPIDPSPIYQNIW